jgi:hypothetical protein
MRPGHLGVELETLAEQEGHAGAPHGMCTTLKDQVKEDLIAFIKA